MSIRRWSPATYLKKKWIRPKGHYSSPAQGHTKYVLIHWHFVCAPYIATKTNTIRRSDWPAVPSFIPAWLAGWIRLRSFDRIDTPSLPVLPAIEAEAPTVAATEGTIRELGQCHNWLDLNWLPLIVNITVAITNADWLFIISSFIYMLQASVNCNHLAGFEELLAHQIACLFLMRGLIWRWWRGCLLFSMYLIFFISFWTNWAGLLSWMIRNAIITLIIFYARWRTGFGSSFSHCRIE